ILEILVAADELLLKVLLDYIQDHLMNFTYANIKRDDLDMVEEDVWDQVIKWGLAQNPSFDVNLREWDAKEFQALALTLQE
ncbi:17915_t:CDS:2, partial [Funneliformis caledonium]